MTSGDDAKVAGRAVYPVAGDCGLHSAGRPVTAANGGWWVVDFYDRRGNYYGSG